MGYTVAMQGFMGRYYNVFLTISTALLVAVAFYTGFLEGKRTSNTQPVILSCKDNVLDKLSIPLENIIKPTTVSAATDSTEGASANPSSSETTNGRGATAPEAGKYVGSKNGTKYYPSVTCSSAKRIKPENYIWFSDVQEAEIQGYTQGKC